VLVERVEGFAAEADWRRAYDEINDFEAQLLEADSLVLKFYLHIDADEQLRRFRAREQTPYKKYKISEDDYRNRENRDAYREAAAEMFERTGTEAAPWHVVPANDKRWARVAVLDTLCRALACALPAEDG
jgi:polyphosphate kinase 2 (PPK2 family)